MEKKNIIHRLGEQRLFFDGGTGTVLAGQGLRAGEPPEVMNDRAPEVVAALHAAYVEAGANIIKTNTFGINSHKYEDYDRRLRTACSLATSAVAGRDAYVAFDVGPTGRMLAPLGDLDFEDATEIFAKNMRLAEECGCDLILIETMSDLYETKAALLAAKENSRLPVFVTCAFGSDGKLLTGATPAAILAMLEGMGADAVGMNCSTGPREMMGVISDFMRLSSVPVIVNPNAGLPRVDGNDTVYDISVDEFAECMRQVAALGVSVLGGCCGTTPEYIAAMVDAVGDVPYAPPTKKDVTMVSSFARTCVIGERPIIVGERLNPTGKAKLKAALREGDTSYLLSEAIAEEEEGADILDLNCGLADIDETEAMARAVVGIQSVTPLPLQIDTGKADTLARAMRLYQGKPMVNSVTGAKDSMDYVFPLVKKYGGTVIALTMDDSGIPETSEGRVEIAERILAEAERYGIEKKDLVFDPLAMTVASGADNALVTLDAIRELKRRGYKTSLGVSNVSFGLPERDAINSAFFTAALWAGLDMAIINPHSPHMMNAYYSYLALSGKDEGCVGYTESVRRLSQTVTAGHGSAASVGEMSLGYAVEKGLSDVARTECVKLLEKKSGTDVINEDIIPALDKVGDGFEKKTVFLPSLLKSAEAASAAFEEIKARTEKVQADERKTLVLATVKGDIHDIGKNIVKLMFESYGYRVVDLGKDVPKERVLEALRDSGAPLLGLSALMTTTLPAMKETVELVQAQLPKVKIIVGGAVLTDTYARQIGAEYAPDAMSAIRLAEKFWC